MTTTPCMTAIAVPTRLGRLHARIAGEGPIVVAWPSMFVDGHTFDRMIPALTRDRRLVVVDGPGLGLSDPLTRRSTISEAAEAALEVIAALDAGPVDWIGNAFGGHVGLKLAQRDGALRSLVAVSAPTEPIDDALRRQIRLLLPIVRAIGACGHDSRRPYPGPARTAGPPGRDRRGVLGRGSSRPLPAAAQPSRQWPGSDAEPEKRRNRVDRKKSLRRLERMPGRGVDLHILPTSRRHRKNVR